MIESYFANGVHSYGPAFENIQLTLRRMVQQVRESTRTPLLSVILEGAVASGKTAIAAQLAAESNFPFVRMVTPDSMIGMDDSQRCNQLMKIFSDSYRSPLSIIVLDDIERIIEYTPVGHRLMNSVLQTLLILLRKVPTAPSRLLVVATTSISHLLEDLQLTAAFNVTLHVSLLQTPQEYFSIMKQYTSHVQIPDAKLTAIARVIQKPIAVKQLLMVLEMALAEYGTAIDANNFAQCLQTVGF